MIILIMIMMMNDNIIIIMMIMIILPDKFNTSNDFNDVMFSIFRIELSD